MNEFWGRVHFWCSFVFMNLVFMPMFAQGIKGMLRRMADGGANYSAARVPGAIDTLPGTIMELHTWILWAAVALGIAQIPFIINLFWSIRHGEKGRRQSVARDDAGMADAHAAAARQFCRDSRAFIAGLTNTACPATTRISRRRTSRKFQRPFRQKFRCMLKCMKNIQH